MAGNKNDAIEIDALLVPELGDMSKVERELSGKLSKAARPLVDTLTDTKVGLNQASLRRAQRQLDQLGRDLGDSFDAAMNKVLNEQNSNLRSAAGLKAMAKSDAGVAKMVKILGGYEAAAGILSRPDAQNRLKGISDAFKKINDVSFQISKLPAVSDDVQKMLTKLYKGNSADGFRKLGEVQQRQVKDAMAIIDLQDKAFASLKSSLAKAGLGVTASDLNRALQERKVNASRLANITSPQAIERSLRQEKQNAARRAMTQDQLNRSAARSSAVSEYKDRVLQRTGGITGLRDKQDISAVRAGLNRDLNMAVQQLALNARGKGGKNSAAYKATAANIDQIQAQRTELNALVADQQRLAKEQTKAAKSQQQAEEKQMSDRAKAQKQQQQTNEAWMRTQADAENKAFDARRKAAEKERAQAEKNGEIWMRTQADWENKRFDQQRAAQEKAMKETTRNLPRNMQQARTIIRDAGGNMDALSRSQLATVRPYLQDRFKARSGYAEGVASRYGADSPEFAKAAASAQQYAAALGELDNRARALKPSISDVGQVVRSFFRYALGYGALYQALGAVTALGKGLVDLDEQLHNIQAITLSTDSQMKTIEGSIKSVGMSTKFTLNEVAKGAQILAQAGTAPERIPAQLKATADFAAATNSSLEQAADVLTSFENVYTSIGDGKAADMLTKALNLSKLQGEDLRTIVSYTAQTAEGYNVGAEQLLGAVATLRNVGIKPSTIATGLRQAMLEVFSPDAKLTKALHTRYKQLGEEMTDEAIKARYNAFTFTDNPLMSAVAELRRIGFGGEAAPLFSRAFDVRAFNPLKALVNNYDQFALMSGQVGVGRSASDASEIQLKSLRATLENLGAAVVAFSDSVGGDMVRSLQAAGEKATWLVQKLTELDQKMKSETGEGLATSIGSGLAGGAIGALLGGKGFTRRALGAATGAYVGSGLDMAGKEGGSASDYALPAIAGLLTIAPAVMDFVGGLRGRNKEIQALAAKSKGLGAADISGTLGPALSFGAGVADFFGSLSKFKVPSKLAGIGLAGGLRLGAGLLARAIPIIGIIYTAYEILSLFSSDQANALQDEIDRARTKAIGAGDQYRSTQAKYDEQQNQINEYRIDDSGNAMAGSTAETAVKLGRQADALSVSTQRVIGLNADQLGAAAELLRNYVDRDEDQRKQDLAKINATLTAAGGKALNDKEAFDISSQMEQLDAGVRGYRDSLVNILNRSTDQLREAISKGDTEGIEKAGAMQRAIDAVPGLRDYLYGRVEVDASKVTEMYVAFNKAMAEESEKGALTTEEVLDKKVDAAVADIEALAAQIGDSAAIEDAVQQIMMGLAATAQNTVAAFNKLAEKSQAAAVKLADQADQLEKEASAAEARADAFDASPRARAEGLSGPYRANALRLREEAGLKRTQATNDAAAAAKAAENAKREQQRDDLAKARAEGVAAEAQTNLSAALQNGSLSKEFRATLSPAMNQLVDQITNDVTRKQLQESGAFTPKQQKTGVYGQSQETQDILKILQASQQYKVNQTEASAAKQKEAAKAAYLSDPEAQVKLAQLENDRRAAERRNDFAGAQKATQAMYGIQYSEQQKAVQRAKVEMDLAKDDPKKDATSAIEKYNSERAKLESLRGDMADKLDEYQKKVQDIDLKNRAAAAKKDQDRVKGQFTEAVDRGDVDAAIKASQEYEGVQARLKAIMEEELKAKGLNAEQIKTEVEDRKDLTVALIDQEAAEKRLTQAVIARSEFELRNAGQGPTTGNKAVDAYIKESGVGFTSQQYTNSYSSDLKAYSTQIMAVQEQWRKQRAAMEAAGRPKDETSKVDQEYLTYIETLQSKIGETAAKMQQLKNQFTDELWEGLNPTALLVGLQNSQYALQNFGEFLRGEILTSIDGVGDALANAALEGANLGDELQSVIHTLASDIFRQGTKLGVNYLAQAGLSMIPGVADGSKEASGVSGMISSMLGLSGGDAQSVGTANISAGTVYVNGASIGGAPSAPGDLPNLASDPNAAAAATGGFFDDMTSSISDIFSGVGDIITNTFSSLSNSLTGLFGSLLGGGSTGMSGGGNIWTSLFQAGANYYTGGASGMANSAASSYTGAQGFAEGGQPSRKIRGARGGRDNLIATATVNGQHQPIRVEADEGILSRRAMDAIGGEHGLNLLNSGSMPRFAVGGAPQPGYNPGQSATTGADRLSANIQEGTAATREKETQVNVANIYSEQAFADFVTSRAGRKVIMNTMRKEGAFSG